VSVSRSVRLPARVTGRLRLHSMPGRNEPLAQTLAHLRSQGVDLIVCLAGPDEIRVKSPEYAAAIEAKTVPYVLEIFPIPDFGVPDDRDAFWSLASSLARRLNGGDRVLIHCGAGIGRTGTLATTVLLALGEPRTEAVRAVSAAGSHPETAEQEALVAWCAAKDGLA
jgi:protein-tyrosine phosphatase